MRREEPLSDCCHSWLTFRGPVSRRRILCDLEPCSSGQQEKQSGHQAGSAKGEVQQMPGREDGITTDDLMKIAVNMAGQTSIPADSKIHVPGGNIRKILFGIDMGVPEILVGKHLGVDCVMAHHPDAGLLTYPEVLSLHVDLAVSAGVPREQAHLVVERMKTASAYSRHSVNYDHAPSFARLLDMPYLNIHNPLDEIGRRIMQEAVDSHTGPDSTVSGVVDALYSLPEFRNAPTKIEIRLGQPGNRAGKSVVVHGAGTNGGAAMARLYFLHGVDTVIYIHLARGDLLRLQEEFPKGKNLIVSGHIASDAVGINPFIKNLESKGITVIRVSGL